MEEYDIIIIGDSGLPTVLLRERMQEMKLRTLTLCVGGKVGNMLKYFEPISKEDFGFNNEYFEFFERVEVLQSLDRYRKKYQQNNLQLHDTLKKQLTKAFPNMMIRCLSLCSNTPDGCGLVVDIEDIKLMHISPNGGSVRYKTKTYSTKQIVSMIRPDNEEGCVTRAVQSSELYDFLPSPIPIYQQPPMYVRKLLISQKTQNCVFTIVPFKKSQKIVIEMYDSVAILMCIGFTQIEADAYFNEITHLFKLNKRSNQIPITMNELDSNSYVYQQYERVVAQHRDRRLTSSTFRLSTIPNTLLLDDMIVTTATIPQDTTYTLCILSSIVALKMCRLLRKNEWWVRGSFNNWSCTAMNKINEYLYSAKITTISPNTELKIDNGKWIESFPIGGNYIIPNEGEWDLYFDSITRSISIVSTNDKSEWWVRGTFNNWEVTHAMKRVGYEYSLLVEADDDESCFKIDDGEWQESYPEENHFLSKGKNLIKFNTLTKSVRTVHMDNEQYIFQDLHKYLFQQPQLFNDLDVKKECLGLSLFEDIFF